MVTTIDGKQDVGDQSGKDLGHQPIRRSSDEMIDFKVEIPI